jgi:hypothetical protein
MSENRSELEAVFRVLAARRRRVALRFLQEHRTVALPDLAELVLERETGDPIAELSPERVTDVYFSLYHTHVPVLEDAGLAWYEQQEDLVGLEEGANDVLARAREAVDSLVEIEV